MESSLPFQVMGHMGGLHAGLFRLLLVFHSASASPLIYGLPTLRISTGMPLWPRLEWRAVNGMV